MASSSSNFIAILAICFLVLQPIYAAPSDLLTPLLDKLCKQVECGKGSCKVSTNSTFGFICECESGWKQIRSSGDEEEKDFKFLPCVIPNCTLDYSCNDAPPPSAPEIKEPPSNSSFYDPCYYANCGEGSCKKSLRYGYTCECNDGYNNVLNVTTLPCFSQCVLGSDCGRLGITVSNDSATTSNRNAQNYASSTLPGSYLWFSTLIISLGLVLVRYID